MDVDLSAADRALLTAAEEAVARYGDEPDHTTAAAARASDGRVVTGLNVYHFTGGPCAELVVIGSAVAAGSPRLEAIVAVGDGGRGVLNPCGRCRQVLFDYFPGIRVIVTAGDELRAVPVADLLP
ncbi:MAG: cytidine deaminase, partial [Actinobacteria bacterium]|nr:cytidine deaminase [Actinomycetota bacterium]